MQTSLKSGSVLPFPILIADVGGTNARFAIIKDAFAEPLRFDNVKAADFDDFDTAIQDHILDHTALMPKSAVLAVAGPIDGDEIDLTNNHWVIHPTQLIEKFGIEHVVVLNDYEAQALAVVALGDDDLHAIGNGVQDTGAHRVVVGPGTGLGVAGLVHAAHTWIPVAGEGGHVDLGPQTARDAEVFPYLERIGGRVSGEQILCGRGMVNLYNAVAKASSATKQVKTPEEVTALAISGDDPVATETIALFSEYLGRVAGDLALVFMARGGIYLSGGITQKIRDVFDEARFRAAFENKAPHTEIMRDIPTYSIVRDDAPMQGLAAYARTPQRFGVALDGRYWTAEGID
ncbi:MAG: glucokinase [Ahrensia sp.]